MNTEKSRYWTFVIYPDSCPDWLRLLQDTHVALEVSPLHDKDVNEIDGTQKKPHRHVMAAWDGPTTEKNVRRVFGSIAANGVLQIVSSARGMHRYFTHADNPEKYQYDDADMMQLNGFDPVNIMSETDKNNLAWEIGNLIIAKDFREYGDLCAYLQAKGERNMYNVLKANTTHFQAFIRSRRYILEKEEKKTEEEKKLEEKIKNLESKKEKIVKRSKKV